MGIPAWVSERVQLLTLDCVVIDLLIASLMFGSHLLQPQADLCLLMRQPRLDEVLHHLVLGFLIIFQQKLCHLTKSHLLQAVKKTNNSIEEHIIWLTLTNMSEGTNKENKSKPNQKPLPMFIYKPINAIKQECKYRRVLWYKIKTLMHLIKNLLRITPELPWSSWYCLGTHRHEQKMNLGKKIHAPAESTNKSNPFSIPKWSVPRNVSDLVT